MGWRLLGQLRLGVLQEFKPPDTKGKEPSFPKFPILMCRRVGREVRGDLQVYVASFSGYKRQLDFIPVQLNSLLR